MSEFTFTPEELKTSCQTALEQWDFNPEDYEDEWGDKSSQYVENYKLVLQQIIESPEDYMDEEEDRERLNLENHKTASGNVPDIWDYLSNRCESFAAVWTR